MKYLPTIILGGVCLFFGVYAVDRLDMKIHSDPEKSPYVEIEFKISRQEAPNA